MRWLWKVGAAAALLALAVFDVDTGLFKIPTSWPWLGFATFTCTLLPAIAWLRPNRALAAVAATSSIMLVFVNPFPETNWGLAETAGLFGVLLVTVLRTRTWWDTPLVLLVITALVVQPFESRGGSTSVILSLILLVIALSLVAGIGFMRMLETARARQIMTVRAEQRAEFARDLHDFVGHHVTGIVVLAQAARRVMERDPAAAATALERIESAGSEAMTAMRRMVGMLRTPDDTPIAPLAGIPELVPLIESHPKARLHVEGPVDDLPVEVTSSVYRVVMEALTNVRRHAAEATRVDVDVLSTGDWITVRVTNDGRVHRGDGKGFGLLGLTERVQALGGRIKAGPGINGGWVVDAALPRVGA